MLNKQQNYLNFTSKAKELTNKHECLNKHQSNLADLEDSIKNQELLVPVIGGFSSGKSSLINSFLATNILSVNITPETAIATELRYSTDERLEAVKDSGSSETYPLSELSNLQAKAQNYHHLRLYLNNQKLKDIEPIILVDMPGFNAPIATHNKAILHYMPSGVYFIALLSGADEKALQRSYLNELNGIYQRNKEFTFCISKTNLIPQSDIVDIANCIKDQLEVDFGYDQEIELLDDDSGAILEKILNNIDCEMLFERIFKALLDIIKTELESALNTTISALRYSEQDAKDAISELENKLAIIESQKEQSLQNAQSKYANTNIEEILNIARSALEANVFTLAHIALRGGDIEKGISNIINSVLPAQIQKCLNVVSKNVIDNFSVSIRGTNFDATGIQTWADGLKDFVETACFVANTALNKDINSKQSSNALVSSATGLLGGQLVEKALSKLGFAINPLVGVLLNTVFAILPGIFSKIADQKREEAVQEKILTEVIPSIIAQIRPDLSNFVNIQIKEIISNIAVAFEKTIAQKQAQIEQATAQKANEIEGIEIEISKLEALRDELRTLAKQYL